MSVSVVVALSILAALAGSAVTAVVFLVRELGRSDKRGNALEEKLDQARKDTTSEARSCSLTAERLAVAQIALEKERIKSGRVLKVRVEHQHELGQSVYDEAAADLSDEC